MAIKNEPLGEQLARELRREILSGSLGVGQLLIEKSLADQYEVSRGPVRDALQRLRTDGLIEPNGRSYRVVEVTAEDISEIYDLRFALEQLAVERARTSSADLTTAQAAIEDMRLARDSGDARAFGAADLAFHRSFYEMTNRRRLLETWQTFERVLEVLLEINPHPNNDLDVPVEDHEQLLDAIRDLSTERWRVHLLEHLDSACSRLGASYGASSSSISGGA